jgi:predicted metal-dependent phosphoesterase TrpH
MIDIDLHLHTNYSDGIESPQEIVRRARRLGLKKIAITDHDGIGGVELARAEGEKIGVKVISGLEFSTTFFYPSDSLDGEEHYMHILGYGIDLANRHLTLKMKDLIEKRTMRNKKMQRAFSESGIPITDEELTENSPSGYVGKVSFARVFVKKGLISRPEEAFSSENLMRSPFIRAIRKDKTQAQEAIKIIHEAGGKAFVAHPFQLFYSSMTKNPESYRKRLYSVLEQLKFYGLDGLECYYPTHDQEQTDYLISLADKLGLLVSVGSDDHGPNVRKIKKINNSYKL